MIGPPVTAKLLKDALIFARGNVTYTGVLLGRKKQFIIRLVRRYRLRTLARDLRRLAGEQPVNGGRPRTRTEPKR